MSSVKPKTIQPLIPENHLTLARAMLGRAVGFRDCEPQAIDALMHAGQLRSLGRGEYAVHRGGKASYAWLVVQGLVEGSITHSDGKRLLLGLLLPGQFFSLMGVVDDCGSEYDVSAREASVAFLIPIPRLRELRDQFPSLIKACEQQYVFRARLFQKRLTLDPGAALDTRVASLLQLLSSLYGSPYTQGIEFSIKLTQTDMAEWLGLSRQRMNFVLKKFETEGLIQLDYSSLRITDPLGLAARADQ